MYAPRFTRLLAIIFIALATLTSAPPTSAAPPEKIIVNETFIDEEASEACGFPIEVHSEGALRVIRRYDRGGRLVMQITAFPRWKVTFTNLTTGASITSPVPAMEKVNYNPDGSFTVATNGLLGHLVVPGRGVVTADVGRVVLLFSGPEDEDPDVIFEAGRRDEGPLPYLCDVLG